MAQSKRKVGYISGVQMRKHLKTMRKLRRRDMARRIAALAERGLTPRPRGPSHLWGCPSFSVCLRVIGDGTVGLDIEHDRRERPEGRWSGLAPFVHIWGAAWPDYDQTVRAAPLLAGLAAAWPVVARPFLEGRPVFEPGPRQEADLAALVGDPSLPPLRIVAEGPGIKIEHAGGVFDPKGESLIVVECLLALGDKLAALLPGSAEAARWTEVRGLAEVFPWSEEGVDVPRRLEAEEAFYAAKFGLAADGWERHMLTHMTELHINNTEYVPFPDLAQPPPPRDGLDARVDEAAARVHMPRDEFLAMARHEFLVDCRAVVYYLKWPEVGE
jgi:hypothetical protein